MKTIRSNAFETNSSSTHSLTIDKSNYTNINKLENITIYPSSFGWEFDKFNDPITKLSYVFTLVLPYEDISDCDESDYWYGERVEMNELYNTLLEVGKEHNIHFDTNTLDGDDYCYVDNGMFHWAKFKKTFPNIKTKEGLWEFITNEAYWIFVGNDNQISPPNWGETPRQLNEYPFLAKFDYNNPVYLRSDNIDDNLSVIMDYLEYCIYLFGEWEGMNPYKDNLSKAAYLYTLAKKNLVREDGIYYYGPSYKIRRSVDDPTIFMVEYYYKKYYSDKNIENEKIPLLDEEGEQFTYEYVLEIKPNSKYIKK